MRVSRLVFGTSASLFGLLLLLGTSGCTPVRQAKQPGKRTIDCVKDITTDAKNGVDPKQLAVYVCEDPGYNQVTWRLGSGVTSFRVQFPTPCPFTSCADLTETQPTATVAAQPTDHIVVYKYSITVNNGTPFDPHVVGGGGY